MSEDADAVIDALFASDLARDVRSEFNARRDGGMSVNGATGGVVEHFRHLLDRPDDGPVVIIALAVLQSLEHEPTSALRDAALDLLQEGHGFAGRCGESVTFRRDRARLRERLIGLLASPTRIPDEPQRP